MGGVLLILEERRLLLELQVGHFEAHSGVICWIDVCPEYALAAEGF